MSAFLLRAWPCPVTRVNDLVYASPDGQPLLADLYLPDGVERPVPTILFLHAGGWRYGDRRTGPDLSRFLAERGFAMASIDYRLSKQAIFPAALEDVKTAIEWLRSIAGTYGLDPGHVGLWGASAGGHLAALAALTGANVQAVVDVYGPTDFLQMGPRAMDPKSYESRFLGAPIDTCPELVRQANPITWVKAGAPPFLILHGLGDIEVPASQSELLYEALAAHGNDVTLCLIEGLAHGFLNDDLDRTPQKRVVLREPGRTVDAPPVTFGFIESFFRKAFR